MAALRIGLISDTHGLLRPEALEAMRGHDRIVHAGDIGDPAILESLARLAPVTAVRGNNDRAPWAESIPETDILDLGGIYVYVLHDVHRLPIDPAAAGFHAVVAGHSHRPMQEHRHGVLYVNPGSAGPRRFTLPVSVGSLSIDGTRISARLTELRVRR